MKLEQKKRKIKSLIALIPLLRIFPEYERKALFKLKILKKQIAEDNNQVEANKQLIKDRYK